MAAASRASPDVQAAREALASAAGRERQAGALANPTLAYGHEQTSRGALTNAQHIAQLELPLEVGGQRTARRNAARLRREGADARLAIVLAQLDFDVARAWVAAIAADQRARLAEQGGTAFTEAQRVSEQRLAAGDVSGYETRRLRLEAARFAAVRAATMLERRSARTALALLLGRPASDAEQLPLPATLSAAATVGVADAAPLQADSLLARALRDRAELRVALLDRAAAAADAALTERERIPTPVFSAGYKQERVADPALGSLTGFRGLVAGLSVPLPVLDRRAGAIASAQADARRVEAEVEGVRRRIAREVADALDAWRAAESQRAALAPHLGEGARIAVQAVQASYGEGEITLVEWLDAIRAYQDAESTFLTLQAEVVVRQAALARAIGAPLTTISSPDSSDR